jgi:hypothetical protein
MACHGADGDGMPLAATNAFKELHHMLGAPVGVVALALDDVGGFNKGPFEVRVDCFRSLPWRVLPPLALTVGTVPA